MNSENTQDTANEVLKGSYCTIQGNTRKQEKAERNNLILHLKKLPKNKNNKKLELKIKEQHMKTRELERNKK